MLCDIILKIRIVNVNERRALWCQLHWKEEGSRQNNKGAGSHPLYKSYTKGKQVVT